MLNARQMIQAEGASSLNMDYLADSVGISKPTLYQHFKSKEDLLAQVLIESVIELGQYVAAMTESSPLVRLKTALRYWLVNRYSRNCLLTGFENELLVSTLYKRSDVIAAKRQVFEQLTDIVEAGKACGELTVTVPSLMISAMFIKLTTLPAVALTTLNAEGDEQTLATWIDGVVLLFERAVYENASQTSTQSVADSVDQPDVQQTSSGKFTFQT